MRESVLPDWFRPDKAKVIVLPKKFSWRGYAVNVAVPVGKRIPSRSLVWLKQYASATQHPLVYMEQENKRLEKKQRLFAYGPLLFMQEVAALVREGKRLWE